MPDDYLRVEELAPTWTDEEKKTLREVFSSPFLLFADKVPEGTPREKVKQLNVNLAKSGVHTIADFLALGRAPAQTLLGRELFNLVTEDMIKIGLGWNIAVDGWEEALK